MASDLEDLNLRYVAAYLLAVLGGKKSPDNADLVKILSSVGVEVDTERLSKVIKVLAVKDAEDLIKKGRENLSSMSVGGASAAAPAVAALVDTAAGVLVTEAKKEEKKEESESESESESEDDDRGFALFV
ncbi:hypothetical protein KR018_002471 [Drosophila ironensis]|nr:hypothetical protein KR018_002471 [Drosophila ironensis]